MGGMHLLYWRSMLDAKQSGMRTFDLGRCEVGQDGLLIFKKRWGAVETPLHYIRFTDRAETAGSCSSRRARAGMRGWQSKYFPRVPAPVLSMLGAVLYKHVRVSRETKPIDR